MISKSLGLTAIEISFPSSSMALKQHHPSSNVLYESERDDAKEAAKKEAEVQKAVEERESSKLFCSKCGAEITDPEAVFCKKCGEKLEK